MVSCSLYTGQGSHVRITNVVITTTRFWNNLLQVRSNPKDLTSQPCTQQSQLKAKR